MQSTNRQGGATGNGAGREKSNEARGGDGSVSGGACGGASTVGDPVDLTVGRVDDDRVGVALDAADLDPMAEVSEGLAGRFRPAGGRAFERQDVGEPGMVCPGRVDGRARIEAEF